MQSYSRQMSLVLVPVVAVLLFCLMGISQIRARFQSQLESAPFVPDLTEAIDLSLDEVSLAGFESPSIEGIVAPEHTQPEVIVRTNSDSARAGAADAEGKPLSWLAEQEWFDRRAFFGCSFRVVPMGARWPSPRENHEPGRVSLILHRITDDKLSILMTLQEEATYRQVEFALLQLANGDPPETDFTIEWFRPWVYGMPMPINPTDSNNSVALAAAAVPEDEAGVVMFDQLATGQIIGQLGLPIGTFCTIRGVWVEDPLRFKTTEWWFRVTHVDGHELAEPVEYPCGEIDYVQGRVYGLPDLLWNPGKGGGITEAGEVWELRVFESLSYDGTPRWYSEESGIPPGAGHGGFRLMSHLNYVRGINLGVP